MKMAVLRDIVIKYQSYINPSGAFAGERIRQGLDYERFAGILADLIVDGVKGRRS